MKERRKKGRNDGVKESKYYEGKKEKRKKWRKE